MDETLDFNVGQNVKLNDGRNAKIRFAGNTLFAPGDWLGVELENNSGKNDGAVQGQRYFLCEPGHGMFIRPSAATLRDQSPQRQSGLVQGRVNAASTKSKFQNVATDNSLRRQSVLEMRTANRMSNAIDSSISALRPSLTPRSVSPTKSPTRRPGSATSSGSGTRNSTSSASQRIPIVGNKAGRLSMAPPSTNLSNARSSRQLKPGKTNGSTQNLTRTTSSTSLVPSNGPSISSMVSNAQSLGNNESNIERTSAKKSPDEGSETETLSLSVLAKQDNRVNGTPHVSQIRKMGSTYDIIQSTTSRARSPDPSSQRPSTVGTISMREVEDLKTKLRVLERKRLEDREKLKTFEKVETERDKLENIIQMLQSKYQPQQQEISDLKKQLKDEAAKFCLLESQRAETDEFIEKVTLDREIAEETAECLRNELDAIKRKYEETILEVEILQEENKEFEKEMSPEEKAKQGWLQMERSNEHLREALVRLRDMTRQQETDLRRQVAELEKENLELGNLKEKYEQMKGKLVQSHSTIDDLKQQLETALGAEEMIEELTERSFSLNEKVENMRATIEDLESLKELNDELELNHTENERQMQEEINYNESLLIEQTRKSALQDETIHDLEYTISRFRDLITTMQNDLEDMRASRQITEIEANEMTNRSKAMMDLNLRLQISASKAQIKAIDVELNKLKVQESADHLEIVQLFLPETFATDQNSILAFLSLKRISFKAAMMHVFIKERVNGQVSAGLEDTVFSCCELMDKLTWMSNSCDRLIKYIQSSSLEIFSSFESTLYELDPVERAFNGWIESLRQDKLNVDQCNTELQRSIALISHLIELHVSEGPEQYANEIHMRANMMQSHLENTAVALSHVKMMINRKVAPKEDVYDKHQAQDSLDFAQKIDPLLLQTRSTKVVVGKAIRQLEELSERSLTLDQTSLPIIEHCQDSTSDLAFSTRHIGTLILKALSEEDRVMPFTCEEFDLLIPEANSFPSISSKIQSTAAQISAFYELTNSLTQTIEFPSPSPPAPWQILAHNMRTATRNSAIHESDIKRLQDEMVEKNTTLALQQKANEELSVKVEVLARRVGESVGRGEKVRELEGTLEAARTKEKDLIAHLSRLQHHLQALEAERETWKNPTSIPQSSPNLGQAPSPAPTHQITKLESEIRALQSSIRHLRSIAYAKSVSTSLSFLSIPLTPIHSPSRLQHEASTVLKNMLHIATHPENQLIELQPLQPQNQRLRWRPVKEMSGWKVARQREEWEAWKDWRDDVSKRVRQPKVARDNAEVGRKKLPKGSAKASVRPSASGARKYGIGEEVTIVPPDNWGGEQSLSGLIS